VPAHRPHIASDIAAQLAERIEPLCRKLLPNGRREGAEWRCGSVNGEAGKSLGVHLVGNKAGTWADFAGDERGDALDLVRHVHMLDTMGAIEWAGNWLGIDYGTRERQAPDRAKPNGASPPGALPPDRHPDLGEPALRHEYTDPDGRLIFYHCRFSLADGGKTYRPLSWHGGQWVWKDPPGPLPLYGLADLAAHPDKPVLLVEGEKTAEVARELVDAYVITTWPHGARAIKRVDWAPLRGRDVTCWPDNDDEGRLGMTAAADLITEAGAARVCTVQLPDGLPEKWDLGDVLPEGWDETTLRELIHQAKPIHMNRPRLRPIHCAQLKDLPRREPLIKGLLDCTAMGVIYGPPNCGKTYIALDMSFHVALGRDWCGRKTKQSTVVYIAVEGGLGLGERLISFCLHHDIALADVPLYMVPDVIDLCHSPGDADALVGEIKAIGPVGMVVIDTLSRAMAGGNENAPDDMGAFVLNCDRLRRESGAHVLVIHHAGKDDGRGARGHTSLKGATDTEIEVSNNTSTGIVTAQVKKQRDGPCDTSHTLRLISMEIDRDEDGEPITSCVVEPIDADQSPRHRERPTGHAKTAYDALLTVVDRARQIAGEDGSGALLSRTSAMSTACPVEQWRAEFNSRCIDGPDIKPDTLSKRFSRAAEKLQSLGFVGFRDGQAWIIWGDRT
jgi:hypothetical protein